MKPRHARPGQAVQQPGQRGGQQQHGHVEPPPGARGLRQPALAAAGWLQIDDPQEAAEHLLALTTGQINNRSMFGVAEVSDADIERIVTSGARAFVRAYRPA